MKNTDQDKRSTSFGIFAVLCAGALATACGQATSEKTNGGSASQETKSALPAGLFTDAIDGAASAISELQGRVEAGQKVVLTGKVMGSMTPFVEGRAAVMVGDPTKLTSCDLRPGDTCTTPWDVCCDDPEVIKKSVATLQVVDGDGRVVAHSLRGAGGLDHLATVTAEGVVSPLSGEENLVVNVTRMAVSPADR